MLATRAVANPPSPQPTSIPQLTVEAQRQALEKRIFRFVTTITEQSGAYESLARWGVKVCPAVTGLSAAQGEFILQRISAIARSAGAPLGSSDCKPNLFVIITPQPSQLIRGIWSRNASKFTDLSGLPASPDQVRRFIDDPRPIRAWYGAELTGAMGNALGTFGEMPQGRAPMVNRLPEMSRVRIDDVQTIRSVLVIVDAGRITGLNIGALADYAAMVGLSKINLDADFSGSNSVLRLFTVTNDEIHAFTQLGTWDAAFLKALYRTDQANRMQRDQIVDRMMHDFAVSPQP